MRELCKLIGVTHDFSTPYHHQTLGGVERNHRVLNEYLRAFERNIDWDVQIKYFTYCYNTSFHTSLSYQYTPFELVFGRRANDFEFLKNAIEPIYNHDRYTNVLKHTLQVAHERAKNFIIRMKERNKLYYDKHTNAVNLKQNDLILVKKKHAISLVPFIPVRIELRKLKKKMLFLK